MLAVLAAAPVIGIRFEIHHETVISGPAGALPVTAQYPHPGKKNGKFASALATGGNYDYVSNTYSGCGLVKNNDRQRVEGSCTSSIHLAGPNQT